MARFPLHPPAVVELIPRIPPSVGPDSLLAHLLQAAADADIAEGLLDRARVAYSNAPTEANLDSLRAQSGVALAREARFDDLWREASAFWMDARALSPPRPRWPGAPL